MIELGLAGKLVSRQQVLDTAEKKLRHMAETCTDADGVLGTKKGVTLAANCIYASHVLRCPAVSPPVSTQRIYSQRDFIKPSDATNRATKLYSQVWTGFLAEVPEKDWKSEGALAIDMGTGELKFGYASRTMVMVTKDPDLVKLRAQHAHPRPRSPATSTFTEVPSFRVDCPVTPTTNFDAPVGSWRSSENGFAGKELDIAVHP